MMKSSPQRRALDALQRDVIACEECPRLIQYCRKVAKEKRRMYRQEEYWGKPLPSFGDPSAALLIVGLAPAAHGGNRTGRMFTGDRSGDFLYRALYETGFANQSLSVSRDDGLELIGCYITAALRCAPPKNKPYPEELRRCRRYLIGELGLLRKLKAVLALGRIAFDAYLAAVYEEYAENVHTKNRLIPTLPSRSSFRFAHGVRYSMPGPLPLFFASYHPSQQNTQTGRLTYGMFLSVLSEIRQYLNAGAHRGDAGTPGC